MSDNWWNIDDDYVEPEESLHVGKQEGEVVYGTAAKESFLNDVDYEAAKWLEENSQCRRMIVVCNLKNRIIEKSAGGYGVYMSGWEGEELTEFKLPVSNVASNFNEGRTI